MEAAVAAIQNTLLEGEEGLMGKRIPKPPECSRRTSDTDPARRSVDWEGPRWHKGLEASQGLAGNLQKRPSGQGQWPSLAH
jgi:hypothetical protein